MRVKSLGRGISRVRLASGEYDDLRLRLSVATERFIVSAFDKTFRKRDMTNPYETMLRHEGGHFYFPENGLTVFIHPSSNLFRIEWSIMSDDGVWVHAHLCVNSVP